MHFGLLLNKKNIQFPTSICEKSSGALVDNKNHCFPYCKKVIKRHIGVKLDETHPTHFLQVSQVRMLTSLRIHESCHYVTKLFIASCFNFGLFLYLSQVIMMGEITVKGAKGTKVKVFF
jgi:hypothetical protein